MDIILNQYIQYVFFKPVEYRNGKMVFLYWIKWSTPIMYITAGASPGDLLFH